MRRVTYGERSILVGDEAADLLMRYAALISAHGGSDVVTLRAVGADGSQVDASVLLNGSTTLMIESDLTTGSEADNRIEVSYLIERIDELSRAFEFPSDASDT
jgi:hypothetical protein